MLVALFAASVACRAPGKQLVRPTHIERAGYSDSIRPLEQSVFLEIDPGRSSFSGKVELLVDLKEGRDRLVLDAAGLRIVSASVFSDGKWATVSTGIDQANELIEVSLSSAAGRGLAKISVDYTGEFGSRFGLIKSSTGGAVYSFLQPSHARRVFPCLDDVRYRVPWTITIQAPRNMRALSNEKVEEQRELSNGWKVTRFSRTEPLPSYLVAVAVGNLDEVASREADLPIRLYAERPRSNEQKIAAKTIDVTAGLLELMSEYLEETPGVSKLDIVAVPDFSVGAMESPGLLAFNAPLVLERTEVFTIAHELAHLWFGDQVSPASWQHLWLSEGIANWLATRSLRELVDRPAPALNGGPMEPIKQPGGLVLDLAGHEQARRFFSDSDAPGWTVMDLDAPKALEFLEHELGPTVLRAALQRFLAGHRGKPASTDDFVEALALASGLPEEHFLWLTGVMPAL